MVNECNCFYVIVMAVTKISLCLRVKCLFASSRSKPDSQRSFICPDLMFSSRHSQNDLQRGPARHRHSDPGRRVEKDALMDKPVKLASLRIHLWRAGLEVMAKRLSFCSTRHRRPVYTLLPWKNWRNWVFVPSCVSGTTGLFGRTRINVGDVLKRRDRIRTSGWGEPAFCADGNSRRLPTLLHHCAG